VDDNLDVAASVRILLEMVGHHVHVVHDGPAALKLAGEMRPHIMLIDIGLNGMSGLEVARQIRAGPLDPAPILVALTGFGTPEDHRRSLDAGFDVHLVKPTEPEVLLDVVTMPVPRDS
jgi:two-component system CheB/CheR fusion protein